MLKKNNPTIKQETVQPTKAPKQMPLKNEAGSVKKPLLKKENRL